MVFWMGLRDGLPIVEARRGFPILDSRLKMSGMTEGEAGMALGSDGDGLGVGGGFLIGD